MFCCSVRSVPFYELGGFVKSFFVLLWVVGSALVGAQNMGSALQNEAVRPYIVVEKGVSKSDLERVWKELGYTSEVTEQEQKTLEQVKSLQGKLFSGVLFVGKQGGSGEWKSLRDGNFMSKVDLGVIGGHLVVWMRPSGEFVHIKTEEDFMKFSNRLKDLANVEKATFIRQMPSSGVPRADKSLDLPEFPQEFKDLFSNAGWSQAEQTILGITYAWGQEWARQRYPSRLNETYVVISEKMQSEPGPNILPSGLYVEGKRWRSFRVLYKDVFYSVVIVGGSGVIGPQKSAAQGMLGMAKEQTLADKGATLKKMLASEELKDIGDIGHLRLKVGAAQSLGRIKNGRPWTPIDDVKKVMASSSHPEFFEYFPTTELDKIVDRGEILPGVAYIAREYRKKTIEGTVSKNLPFKSSRNKIIKALKNKPLRATVFFPKDPEISIDEFDAMKDVFGAVGASDRRLSDADKQDIKIRVQRGEATVIAQEGALIDTKDIAEWAQEKSLIVRRFVILRPSVEFKAGNAETFKSFKPASVVMVLPKQWEEHAGSGVLLNTKELKKLKNVSFVVGSEDRPLSNEEWVALKMQMKGDKALFDRTPSVLVSQKGDAIDVESIKKWAREAGHNLSILPFRSADSVGVSHVLLVHN